MKHPVLLYTGDHLLPSSTRDHKLASVLQTSEGAPRRQPSYSLSLGYQYLGPQLIETVLKLKLMAGLAVYMVFKVEWQVIELRHFLALTVIPSPISLSGDLFLMAVVFSPC